MSKNASKKDEAPAQSATLALFEETALEYAQLAAEQEGHSLAKRLKSPSKEDLAAIAHLVSNVAMIAAVAAQNKPIDASAAFVEARGAIARSPWLKIVAQDFLEQTELAGKRKAALVAMLG